MGKGYIGHSPSAFQGGRRRASRRAIPIRRLEFLALICGKNKKYALVWIMRQQLTLLENFH
jgi:hypothetical protein